MEKIVIKDTTAGMMWAWLEMLLGGRRGGS